MATKPVEKPIWAETEAGNVVSPPGSHQTNGWGDTEVPTAQWQNWLHKRTLDWVNYFESVTDSLVQSAGTLGSKVATLASDMRRVVFKQRKLEKRAGRDLFHSAIF